ncbi:MAG TPA: Uma2 family endonuclease [Chloroflexota bacterium]|nr:Uma2 family endonuclease [Chloroflexota bacterium]
MAATVDRMPFQFTVDDYYRLAEVGILKPDDRVELIEGEIVRMSPIGSKHAATVERARRLFEGRLGDHVSVRSQNPVRLDRRSEPEPDLTLVRFRADYYAETHPTPRDVLLIIEVADTTLHYDRHVKALLYARAGIPEYWIVDLTGDAIEAHTEPSPDGYRVVRRYQRGERLSPQVLPEVELAVEEILS